MSFIPILRCKIERPSHQCPIFDGTNYVQWKQSMQEYLNSTEKKLWKLVDYGCTTRSWKPDHELNPLQKKERALDKRAMNIIRSSLCSEAYKDTLDCETAKRNA